MIHLLITGLAILVLGLNLIMIYYMLSITPPNTPEVIAKLIARGKRVCLAGGLVIILGIISFMMFSQPEGVAIIVAGANVIVLGIAYIVRAKGHENERAVRAGAWFSAGFGTGMILAYGIVVHLLPFLNSL